jgi:hypothetical protein
MNSGRPTGISRCFQGSRHETRCSSTDRQTLQLETARQAIAWLDRRTGILPANGESSTTPLVVQA